MLVTIAINIRFQNQHLYEPENTHTQVNASGTLICMCVIVCLLPVMQVLYHCLLLAPGFCFHIHREFWKYNRYAGVDS